ncbi:MAG: hypothetical protein GTO14_19225 [Anaerolineales bacterium]|nr:hypothetical protein [Anaerolineales bacterium]
MTYHEEYWEKFAKLIELAKEDETLREMLASGEAEAVENVLQETVGLTAPEVQEIFMGLKAAGFEERFRDRFGDNLLGGWFFVIPDELGRQM